MAEREILARVPWFRTGGIIAAVIALGVGEMHIRDPLSWESLVWIVVTLGSAYLALTGLFNNRRYFFLYPFAYTVTYKNLFFCK